MRFNMRLYGEPYQKIVSGRKTIEVRLLDEKRRHIHVGDVICFTNTDNHEQRIKTKVIALHRFPSFVELFDALPAEKLGVTPSEKMTACTGMTRYYSKEQQDQYEAIGIEFELLEDDQVFELNFQTEHEIARAILPCDALSLLLSTGEKTFIMTIGRDRRIPVIPGKQWGEMIERINRIPPPRQAFLRPIVDNAERLDVDFEGEIEISADLLRKTEVGTNGTIKFVYRNGLFFFCREMAAAQEEGDSFYIRLYT